jgi:N-acetylglucosamine-6-phosphate deacetylase
MATEQNSTMSATELQRFAERLIASGTTRALSERLTEMQSEMRRAARVIRTLLRHTAPSDVFVVHGDDAGEGSRD